MYTYIVGVVVVSTYRKYGGSGYSDSEYSKYVVSVGATAPVLLPTHAIELAARWLAHQNSQGGSSILLPSQKVRMHHQPFCL